MKILTRAIPFRSALAASLIFAIPSLSMSENTPTSNQAVATFGGGCFWCTEAVFERVIGVSAVESGYAGGHVKNPTYRQVTGGDTGHAEVIQITYDPQQVTYEELLQIFWQAHDPTTLNRQGADVGPQYRSIILYHDDDQKAAAEKSKAEADASGKFNSPIVTEITNMTTFYPAEDYHQDYFRNNKTAPYCQYVIHPKLQKFKGHSKMTP